jgi:hypothetical protein
MRRPDDILWSPQIGVKLMTGETISDLLQPLIGKTGSIAMIVSRVGHVAVSTTGTKKLTSVEVRPDGLVRLERETGWAVIDPRDVVVVASDCESETLAGQFL